jgi:multidrug resistance efflux pump
MQFGLAQIKAQLLRDRKFNHSLYDNLDRGIVNEAEYRVLKERRDADIFSALAEKARLEKGIAALKGQIARYEALRQAMKDLNRSHHLSAGLVEFLVERLDITHDREITLTARFEDEWEQHSEVWRQCASI